MRYTGTITGLQATTPTAAPGVPAAVAEERPGPNYLRLALVVVVIAGIAYLVGRRR